MVAQLVPAAVAEPSIRTASRFASSSPAIGSRINEKVPLNPETAFAVVFLAKPVSRIADSLWAWLVRLREATSCHDHGKYSIPEASMPTRPVSLKIRPQSRFNGHL